MKWNCYRWITLFYQCGIFSSYDLYDVSFINSRNISYSVLCQSILLSVVLVTIWDLSSSLPSSLLVLIRLSSARLSVVMESTATTPTVITRAKLSLLLPSTTLNSKLRNVYILQKSLHTSFCMPVFDCSVLCPGSTSLTNRWAPAGSSPHIGNNISLLKEK